MGNVKARKTRHLRVGAPIAHPTAQQVLTNIADGAVTDLTSRLVSKAYKALRIPDPNAAPDVPSEPAQRPRVKKVSHKQGAST